MFTQQRRLFDIVKDIFPQQGIVVFTFLSLFSLQKSTTMLGKVVILGILPLGLFLKWIFGFQNAIYALNFKYFIFSLESVKVILL